MNTKDPLSNLIKEAFPAQEPSPGLRDRIEARHAPQRLNPRWLALGSACAAGGVGLTVLLLTGAPTKALANEILRHANDPHGHTVTYNLNPDGSRTVQSEIWLDGEKRRTVYSGFNHSMETVVDASRSIDVSWDGNRFAFGLDKALSSKSRGTGKRMDLNTLSDVLSLYREVSKKAPPSVVRGTFNGKPADSLDLNLPMSRTQVFADPETHRIVGFLLHMEEPVYEPRTWRDNAGTTHSDLAVSKKRRTVNQMVLMDDAPPPAGTFDPVFDVDGRKVNAYELRRSAQEQLSADLASFPISGGRLTIHAVDRNANGDVFVLYTVSGPTDGMLVATDATDGAGSAYMRGRGFEPSSGDKLHWPGPKVDGLPVRGNWFTRIGGGTASGPVTLTFGSDYPDRRVHPLRHTFLPREDSGMRPEWMPILSFPIGDASKLVEQEVRGAAEYYTGKKPDYAKAISLWNRYIQLMAPEIAAMRKIAPGLPETNSEAYYNIGRCYLKMGRRSDAIQAFERARDDSNVPFDRYADEATQVLRQLGHG
jgi:hypothetical protein